MTFDLAQLSIADTLSCSAKLRAAIEAPRTLEAAARKACSYLYDAFVDSRGKRAAVLVRLYVTHPYAELAPADQRFARNLLSGTVARWPSLKCLTLVATRGDEDDWNDRKRSRGHRAIPLPTAATLEQAPMIAQLFLQMGVELSKVLKSEPALFPDLTKKSYNVFHVPRAAGSPFIPAQDGFVQRYGIASVVGFGGALPWGEHFAVVIFSRAPISATVASRFKSFALDLKARFLKFTLADVFDPEQSASVAGRLRVAGRFSAERETSLANVEARVTAAPPQVSGFREFKDSGGVEWKVWAVVPATTAVNVVRLRGERWQSGWLLFESGRESRRLSPIPENWLTSDAVMLEALCRDATPARR